MQKIKSVDIFYVN